MSMGDITRLAWLSLRICKGLFVHMSLEDFGDFVVVCCSCVIKRRDFLAVNRDRLKGISARLKQRFDDVGMICDGCHQKRKTSFMRFNFIDICPRLNERVRNLTMPFLRRLQERERAVFSIGLIDICARLNERVHHPRMPILRRH